MCGGDQLLPDPSRFVSVDELGFEVTCADIELNEEDESCDIIQSTYSMACCASTTSTTENTTLTGSNATINNEISNETEQTSSPGFNATIDNETATEIVPESDETLHQGNDTTLTTENSTTSTASNKTTGDDATETETQGGSTEIVEIIVNETLSPSNDLDDSIETKPVNPDEQEVLNSTILSVTSSATVYSGVCSTLFYCFAGVYVIILVVSCD